MDKALLDIWNQHKLHNNDKTLLLIDETNDEQSHKWFLNCAEFVVLDADTLAKKRLVQKKSVASILAEARFLLIYAIKHGKTLVVRMGESKTDFLGVFCDEVCSDLELQSSYPPYQAQSYLPRQFLLEGGSAMVTSQYLEELFHRADKSDLPISEENKESFCVIITTTIPASKIENQLLNGSFGLPGTLEDYNIQSLHL